jgi:transcriptional regulator with XRE-family HTH domain
MSKKLKIPAHVSSLGEAIRFLRDKQGVSLRALADSVGVSAPFLSDLEHGRRQTDKFDELAKALNVDVEDLKAFDPRVSPALKEWLAINPKVVSFLNHMQRSGQAPSEEMMQALLKKQR